jgi:hypothetical protein
MNSTDSAADGSFERGDLPRLSYTALARRSLEELALARPCIPGRQAPLPRSVLGRSGLL